MSFLRCLLFLGGWLPLTNLLIFFYIPPILWFSLKALILIFAFIWIRACFPRYRYDQLMNLTWRIFLPGAVSLVIMAYAIF